MQWSPVPTGIGSHNNTNTLSKTVKIRSHMNPFQLLIATDSISLIQPFVRTSISNKMLGTIIPIAI
jgi:hypothetical protein